ncbi:hypothetical protein WICMUC_000031 [Wickerhamomyces mucosus]|uniref:Rab-GAP TBC domain-containing protein n=1 Tax=Wickerhamomyces mucosus TaxID=1378264 RepID=A0A9P8PYV9_9ASCO|nr:hypothetical protein WICMUC_000031 [Wickerhamomyces mucosus]
MTNYNDRSSLGRSKSVNFFRNPKRNSIIPQNQSPLHTNETPLDAPIYSRVPADSVNGLKPNVANPKDSIFERDSTSSNSIPGNLHVSSNSSIEHLISRYGAATLIRQLSTDLAQREAELSVIRRKNSQRENTLIKLLNEVGLSTSHIELILKRRLEKYENQDKAFLDNSIQDALAENLSQSFQEGSIEQPLAQPPRKPHKNDASKRRNRPYSMSSFPILNSSSSNLSFDEDSSILNVVSQKFLNNMPQQVQDVILNSTGLPPKNLPPVEMDSFESIRRPSFKDFAKDGEFVDKFGFLYGKNFKRSSSSSKIEINKSITTKLLEIASDHDKTQQLSLRQWDDLIKKITLINSREENDSTEILTIKGENISSYKSLHNEFKRLILTYGIPMNYRPKIWFELLYVKDITTPGEYYNLLNHNPKNEESEGQIKLDINRTMPFNVFFKDNGPGLKKLNKILIAFSRKFPRIGYCQGMNFIVANLLLVFPNEEDTFWGFVGLVQLLPDEFFQLKKIRGDLNKFKNIFSKELPKLQQHFKDLNVEIELICFNWFISIFSESLPIEIVLKVWDLLILNGYIEIYKHSIALFKMFENTLLKLSTNVEIYEVMKNLNKSNRNLKGSELTKLSSNVVISEKDLL